jgi:bacillithiol system protein YtxJ
MPTTLLLDTDPALALDAIRRASQSAPVLVFKKSPICPVSTTAERELRAWLDGRADADELSVAWIDVIGERELARGLTRALDVEHQSPQALWFQSGELMAHESHSALNAARFEAWTAGTF